MWRVWIGLVLVMFGVSAMGLGKKWLGDTWIYIGLASGVIGLLLCLAGDRFDEYMRERRRGKEKAGDYGDAHYTSGQSASFSDSPDAGGGDN
jgi:hypothetical protein